MAAALQHRLGAHPVQATCQGLPFLPHQHRLNANARYRRAGAVVTHASVATLVAVDTAKETKEIHARFSALHAEVSSYRALTAENSLLECEAQRLSQDNASMRMRVALLQQDAQQQLHQIQEQTEQQLRELRAEAAARLQATNDATLRAKGQLRQWQDERQQVLVMVSSSSTRLRELIFTGPDGLPLHSTAAEADVPPPAIDTPQTQPQPQAAAPASSGMGTVLARLGATVRAAVYYSMAALVLYYSGSVLRGAPPTLGLEFGLGALVVSWMFWALNRLLLPRPCPAAA